MNIERGRDVGAGLGDDGLMPKQAIAFDVRSQF
jgi:hypothetical protein